MDEGREGDMEGQVERCIEGRRRESHMYGSC